MALLGSAAALALVPSVFAVPTDRQPVTAPAAADAAAEVTAGRTLYLAHCQTCHGPDGQGTANGPTLVGVGAASADFELRTGRMPFAGPTGAQPVRKPPAFDDAKIRALVAYVASLGPGPAIPSPVIDNAQISNGQRLFVENCAPCHGVTANGGAVGGGALAPPLDKATAVEVGEALLIGPGQMPVFSGLSETDRNAIISYVEYLHEAPNPGGFSIGGIGPVPEGYAAWVLGLALMMIVIILIARDWKGGTA